MSNLSKNDSEEISVICVDDKDSNLTLLKEYKVLGQKEGVYVLKNDLNQIIHSFKNRFRTVEEARELITKQLD